VPVFYFDAGYFDMPQRTQRQEAQLCFLPLCWDSRSVPDF